MMLRARNQIHLQVEQLETREVPALFGGVLSSLSTSWHAPAQTAHQASALQVIGQHTPTGASSTAHVASATALPAATHAAASSQTGLKLSPLVTQIIAYTNQERTQHGLAPLTVNARLTSAANYQATEMATMNTMSHTLQDGLPTPQSRLKYYGYQWRWWGENIAWGYVGAQAVTTAWWNSPEHRANILNPHFTEIGVAVHYNAAGQPFYCVDFGQPQ